MNSSTVYSTGGPTLTTISSGGSLRAVIFQGATFILPQVIWGIVKYIYLLNFSFFLFLSFNALDVFRPDVYWVIMLKIDP